jgi:hypothetical protein
VVRVEQEVPIYNVLKEEVVQVLPFALREPHAGLLILIKHHEKMMPCDYWKDLQKFRQAPSSIASSRWAGFSVVRAKK